MKEFPPFYIGQKVVALKTGVDIIKDKIYTISSCFMACCEWTVTLNEFPHMGEYIYCGRCFKPVSENGPLVIAARYFAPIIEDMQAVTFEKITELEPISIN